MKKVMAVILSTVWFAGCGADAGSEYLGKWQRIKFEKQTLQIDRNGDNFIVRETGPNMISGGVKTQNLPATLKDGILQISGQIGTVGFVVDKASGHLTGPNAEYQKIN